METPTIQPTAGSLRANTLSLIPSTLTENLYTSHSFDPEILRQAEEAVSSKWRIGDVILDLYEVVELLGRGGMGQVYKVKHRGWNFYLAVKTPLFDTAIKTERTERFTREAETWVEIGLHPHIATCYYVRTLGWTPHVFAEYVEGGSLADWIRNQKLHQVKPHERLAKILDIAIQTAWGLQFAHEHGVVHQDIKPANIMMTPEGVAKITDFGGGLTQAYCSPELARGDSVTLHTDIWSWGISVLEMFTSGVSWLTGQAAPQVLEGCFKDSLQRENIVTLPDSLANLLRRCFQIDLHARPPHMKDVIENLLAIYEAEFKQVYPRPEPRRGQGTASILNNRALSLLDLGKLQEAELAWKQALEADPRHPETVFNSGLWRWRRGLLTDGAFIQQLRTMASFPLQDWTDKYLLALFHLERGDLTAARPLLQEAFAVSRGAVEVQNALNLLDANAIAGDQSTNTVDLTTCSLSAGHFTKNAKELIGANQLGEWYSFDEQIQPVNKTITNLTSVTSATVSSNGTVVATGDRNNRFQLWDNNNGWHLRSIELSRSEKLLARWLRDPNPSSKQSSIWRAIKLNWLVRGGFIPLIGSLATVLSTGGPIAVLILVSFMVAIIVYFSLRPMLRRWFHNNAHLKFVSVICFSPDGRRALSWSGDYGMNVEILRYWDVASGRGLQTLLERSGEETSFRLRPEGWLEGRVGSALGALVGTYPPFHLLPGREEIVTIKPALENKIVRHVAVCMCISNNGNLAVTGDSDGNARLYDLRTGTWLRDFTGHAASIHAVAFSTNDDTVLTGAEDGSLRLWDTTTGSCLQTFFKHEGRITSVAFNPDANRILSGSVDATVRLWEIKTGRCVRTYKGHRGGVQAVSFNDRGEVAVSLAEDQSVRHWTVPRNIEFFPMQVARVRLTDEVLANEKHLEELLQHGDEAIQDAAFDKALALGQQARSTSGFERMRENLAGWEKLSHYCQRVGVRGSWPSTLIEQFDGEPTSFSMSRDGRYVLAANWANQLPEGKGHTLRLLDVYEGQLVCDFKYGDSIKAICMDEHSRFALSGGPDGQLILWDLRSRRYLRTLWGHNGIVSGVAIMRRGRFGMSCGEDRTLRWWDLETGRCLRTKGASGNSTLCLDVTNRYALSSADDGTLLLWDVANADCLLRLRGHQGAVRSFSFTADGRRAISGGEDGRIHLWDLRTGESISVVKNDADVLSVSISSDGRYVLSGSSDSLVQLWDLEGGLRLFSFAGHSQRVTAVALSPNGRFAISGSADRTLRLWEIDWELAARPLTDWDEGARPYCENFLQIQTPVRQELNYSGRSTQKAVRLALSCAGRPTWNEEELEELLLSLRQAGYGWLRPNGIRNKLNEIAIEQYDAPLPKKRTRRWLGDISIWSSTLWHSLRLSLRLSRSTVISLATVFGLMGVGALCAMVENANESSTRIRYEIAQPSNLNTAIPDWSPYRFSNSKLSIALPTDINTLTEGHGDPSTKANDEYVIDLPYYGVHLWTKHVVLRQGQMPANLFIDYFKAEIAKTRAKKLKVSGTRLELGRLKIEGTYTYEDSTIRLDGLVLVRGSEGWGILTLRNEQNKLADSAISRVLESISWPKD